MATVIIAVKHAMPELLERLEESMFFFGKGETGAVLKTGDIDGWPHVSCELSGNNSTVSAEDVALLRYYLSQVLTDFITHNQQTVYLDQILGQYYFYFPQNEREEILRFAANKYNQESKSGKRLAMCGEIRNSLYQYLTKQGYINLHGFIVFRLQEWMSCLRQDVDQAVDDFLMEKEYQEFVKLLKYFVELQQPKINQVHVVLDLQGNIQLLDQNYQHIDQSGMEWENMWDEGEQDDHLVSMLITVAPHRVVLHRQIYTHYAKATDTLKHVFENRVVLCKRCKLCQDISGHLHLKGK
ncbi:MAG: putative sporulation protein YtxC [Clostridiales bacterium]|nr:putative sporulation protein YtxC [Clostridiales bacterium]